ncbi:hypothetical protein UFOVP620_7 [uncultured Caudovirales phage]|uniref:DNA transfer protein p32 n=1 Tax=uncultured Caudovirales phage TaxID=2100421 RepID=A0A6J5N9G5_9CAUD|nr:hypothetical protein UFOVP620_7 [uncultured Caudovirales phage]
MFNKVYASRSQTRAMGLHEPIGDPFGGVAYGERNDPMTAAVVVGSSLIGSSISAKGARDAARTQADAQANAQNQLLATGQQAANLYQPYQNMGLTGLNQLNTNMPYLTSQFSNQDLNAQLAPNYAFQLQQGQGATNAASNATGGMVGGNALRGLQDYTQNFASNAYQNAFNNYNANQTNLYNRLSGITGIGYQANVGAANAMLGTGTNIANLTTGIGNATAAGQIGQANAYGGAATNVGNLAFLSSLGQGQQQPQQLSGAVTPAYGGYPQG